MGLRRSITEETGVQREPELFRVPASDAEESLSGPAIALKLARAGEFFAHCRA